MPALCLERVCTAAFVWGLYQSLVARYPKENARIRDRAKLKFDDPELNVHMFPSNLIA